jgi:3-methylcrotonyl-CoA carboxylase alpha subunit
MVEALVNGHKVTAFIVENCSDITVFHAGRVVQLHLHTQEEGEDSGAGGGRITTPMPGRIVSILVKKGQAVEKGQPLLIMESMKVEITIRAGLAGVVEDLPVGVNDQVADGALLAHIAAKESA